MTAVSKTPARSLHVAHPYRPYLHLEHPRSTPRSSTAATANAGAWRPRFFPLDPGVDLEDFPEDPPVDPETSRAFLAFNTDLTDLCVDPLVTSPRALRLEGAVTLVPCLLLLLLLPAPFLPSEDVDRPSASHLAHSSRDMSSSSPSS